MFEFRMLQILLAAVVIPAACHDTVFNVLDFGAKGDGVTDDTRALRKALDAATDAGGGIVLLPAPYTFLSGSIHLESHIIFRVEQGATLVGSTLYSSYPVEWIPGGNGPDQRARQSLIAGARCKTAESDGCTSWTPLRNVTMDGGGVIDGQGSAWWWAADAGSPAASQRPDMIQPALVHGLVIRDLTFRAAPAWTLHPLLCKDVLVERILIDSGVFIDDLEYNGHNVDGFDPDSCERGASRLCDPRRGRLRRNLLQCRANDRRDYSECHMSYTPIYYPWSVGFKQHSIQRYGRWGAAPTFRPRWWKTALRLKSDRNTNGTLQNISYHNIQGLGVDLLFDIQMWYPCQNQSGMANYRDCRSFYPVESGIRPHIRNVSLVNVTGVDTWRTGWLNCLPESPCKDITVETVVAEGAHGWMCEHIEGHSAGGNQPSIEACFS